MRSAVGRLQDYDPVHRGVQRAAQEPAERGLAEQELERSPGQVGGQAGQRLEGRGPGADQEGHQPEDDQVHRVQREVLEKPRDHQLQRPRAAHGGQGPVRRPGRQRADRQKPRCRGGAQGSSEHQQEPVSPAGRGLSAGNQAEAHSLPQLDAHAGPPAHAGRQRQQRHHDHELQS